MKRLEIVQELEVAYNEVVKLINNSSERGQFNSAYFEQPFKEWFADKMDKLEVNPPTL